MRTILLFILFISNSFAIIREEQNALNHIQKAVLKYPKVNRARKKIEKRAIKMIPLEKKTISIAGTVILIATEQKINTRQIKNMDLKIFKGKLRPNASYNFKNKEAFGSLDFTMSW